VMSFTVTLVLRPAAPTIRMPCGFLRGRRMPPSWRLRLNAE
jgi:hypothetical protein